MKKQWKLLKSGLLFKKMENFTGKLLQNYKQLEREIFRILLKHASNQCFLNLHDCTFNIEKMTIKQQKRHFEFVKPI